jgi:cysteinyl-tRNA synthetase
MNVQEGEPFAEIEQFLYDLRQEFIEAMDDDLNISEALASLFKSVRKINHLIMEKKIDPQGSAKVVEAFHGIDAVLNVFDFGLCPAMAEMQQIMEAREKARHEKNWPLADQLRDQLLSQGIPVQDPKIG